MDVAAGNAAHADLGAAARPLNGAAVVAARHGHFHLMSNAAALGQTQQLRIQFRLRYGGFVHNADGHALAQPADLPGLVLLARVVELTGGDSLESNIQLVLNNARLAARTACALAK